MSDDSLTLRLRTFSYSSKELQTYRETIESLSKRIVGANEIAHWLFYMTEVRNVTVLVVPTHMIPTIIVLFDRPVPEQKLQELKDLVPVAYHFIAVYSDNICVDLKTEIPEYAAVRIGV